MNNPQTRVALGIRHRQKKNKTENTTEKIKNTDPIKNPVVHTGSIEEQKFPVSYKTTAVLLTVK